MAILFRAFIEATSIRDAQPSADALHAAIKEHLPPRSRIKIYPLERYWKIETYIETGFMISVPKGTDEPALERRIAKALATRWHWLPSGEDAVWQGDGDKKVFKIPAVRWSELALRE